MRTLNRLQPAVRLLALGLLIFTEGAVRADPIINEFLASNTKTNADNDGKYSDWIEIFNPDSAAANLNGWYLTDDPDDKKKWRFPAVDVPAGGYLLVRASGENRRDPTKPLHTNFSLNKSGEYLALVKSDGNTVVTEFAPTFPAQFEDVSYGSTQPALNGETPARGYFRVPTPGARNSGASGLLLTERVAFSRGSGPFTDIVSLTLSGATAGQRIRYTVSPPAARAAGIAEPTPASTEYTGPIAISSSSIVRATVFAADNIARGYPATVHYVRLATSGADRLDTFATQLPIVVVDTHGTGALVKDSVESAAWIYAWPKPAAGNTTFAAAPVNLTSGTAKVRGSSSANFLKKSYTIKANDTIGNNRRVPLLSFPAFDDWNLVGPWQYDRTFIYNAFIYSLSNRIGRWAARTEFVEVFFNADGGDLDASDYAGVYVLTDALRVDPDRVDIHKIDPGDLSAKKITGGYLLKIDLPDPDEFSFQLKRDFPGLPLALTTAYPKAADMPKAQRDYVRDFLQGFDDTLFANYDRGWADRTYLDYIDRPSWVDHHILNVLAMNSDALSRSAFMTKDRRGRLAAGPVWDFDRSMGGDDIRAQDPQKWSTPESGTDYWGYGWWNVLAREPEFVQAWIDRWQKLRRAELSTPNLLALVDSLAAQIGPAAAARDAAKWTDNASRFPGGWQGEIDNMKSWLTRRAAWIDSQFLPQPTVVAAGGTLTVTPAPGTQIAYTTDGSDPRAFGSPPAFGVRFSSTPVIVPDTTDLQARSYRANFPILVVPGSGWSGAVGGPLSSVITPRPRLANISSRGFIGTGENILIAGTVVNDTAGKQYLARAVGPGLTAFGVVGALAQPVLRIIDSNTGREIASNSGWETGPDVADIADFTKAVGAFPLSKGSKDAAILARLPTGQFTLLVASATSGTGVGLVEVYEVDSGVGRTVNFSTRGLVRSGEELLIGGVVVRGPGPKRLLIRAIGPTLGGFGVAEALADPVLTLFNSPGAQIAANDDWGTPTGGVAGPSPAEVAAASVAVGAFPLVPGTKDAVLLLTLPEGAYTAQVSGKIGSSGVILLELYEVP